MIKKYAVQGFSGLAIGLMTLLSACNGSFEKVLPDTDYSDSINVIYGNPKVLYLIVDGARGVSVRDAQAPHITSLLPNSIYSWVRSEEHTSELQSLMRTSYAVLCLKKKKITSPQKQTHDPKKSMISQRIKDYISHKPHHKIHETISKVKPELITTTLLITDKSYAT